MSVRSGYCTCVHTHGTIALDKHATTDTVASQHILLLSCQWPMPFLWYQSSLCSHVHILAGIEMVMVTDLELGLEVA